MRVLVTGASGRLGTTLRLQLGSNRPEIDPIYLTTPRANLPGATCVDLADLDALTHAVTAARPDAVIHLAGVTGGACERDPELARRINVEATAVIAQAAAAAGALRMVFASTAAVYGDAASHPISENAELAGTSVYALTKREAEQQLALFATGRDDFSVASLRIFNVYGSGFDDSLVSRLLRSTAQNPVPLRGPENFVRDYVLGEDVAVAALAAANSEMPHAFVPINIGTGIPTSNEQLVARLSRRRRIFYTMVDGSASYSCANVEQARALLGFEPSPLTE